MTDQPTPAVHPSGEQLERARKEQTQRQLDHATQRERGKEFEANEIQSQTADARDRAEAMGDIVEEPADGAGD